MKELKRLIPYLVKYKNKLILGFIFVTISNLASTYIPRIVGNTIDTISNGNFSMEMIFTEIGKILILTFFSGLFMYLTRRTIIVASREIEYDLRRDMFDSIKYQSSTFYHRNPTGNLMAYATNDIPAAREFLGPAIMYSANTVTTFSFALYFMLSLDPMIALVGLLPLPILAFVTYKIGRKIHIAFKDVQAQFADLTTLAQESISGVRVIRSYAREIYESLKFANMSRSYFIKNLRLARLEAFMMPALMVLVGLSQLSVLFYGGFKVIDGSSTLGELAQFFIYLDLLIWPVAAIGWVTNLVQRGAASSARLGELMEQKSDIIEMETDEARNHLIEGDIEFQNVSLQYSDDLPFVLQNINLKIKKGTTLGIVGSIGAGKTSLVNLIPRLFNASEGKILIDGLNVKEYPLDLLRSSIGFVPQNNFLFSETIANNISFGKPDASIEEIIDVAYKCKLEDEIKTFADGYETELGERGVTLSGGQKQRVTLARAILLDPKILILDDSLSAVDTNTEDFLLGQLESIMEGRTTIIISHRLSSIKHCDKIIYLHNGEITEEGTHEELLALGGHYSEINKLQQIASEIDTL